MARFFLPPDEWGAREADLPEPEARHAVQVLRLAPGDELTVFDGRGRVAEAKIASASKGRATVTLGAERRVERPRPELHLLVALIKNDRFDWMVQKATELGAASIRPVAAARSVVQIDARDVAKRVAKWRQASVEAAKQCGHLVLPEIYAPRPPGEAFRAAPHGLRGVPALHPEGLPLPEFFAGEPGDVIFAIGPEGDWTDHEMSLAVAEGFVPLDLGRHVLRSETAAVYCLATASHRFLGGAGGARS